MTPPPDPEEARAAIEYCYAQGWSDGLPLVPASQPLIDRFLAIASGTPGGAVSASSSRSADTISAPAR